MIAPRRYFRAMLDLELQRHIRLGPIVKGYPLDPRAYVTGTF